MQSVPKSGFPDGARRLGARLGLDRWLGGTHLTAENDWRWDGGRQPPPPPFPVAPRANALASRLACTCLRPGVTYDAGDLDRGVAVPHHERRSPLAERVAEVIQ